MADRRALAALAYIAFVPGLVRSLIVVGPLAVVVALTANPILDVFDAVDNAAPRAALDSAQDAILLGALVLFLTGSLIGFLDHHRLRACRAGRVARGAWRGRSDRARGCRGGDWCDRQPNRLGGRPMGRLQGAANSSTSSRARG